MWFKDPAGDRSSGRFICSGYYEWFEDFTALIIDKQVFLFTLLYIAIPKQIYGTCYIKIIEYSSI